MSPRRALLAASMAILVLAVAYMVSVRMGAGQGGVEVVDQVGRRVRVPQPVRRIVVLDQASAEILAALGVGDRVVGRVSSVRFPQELLKAKVVEWGGAGPNIEEIMALKPDLIVTYYRGEAGLRALEKTGVPVIAIKWTYSFEDLYAKIRLLGRAVGCEDRAQRLIAYLRGLVSQLTVNSTNPPRVLFIRSGGEGGYEVVGVGIETEAIRLAGGVNVAERYCREHGFTRVVVNMEQILLWNPDVVVISYRADVKPQDILSSPLWRGVKAVETGAVYKVPSDYKYTSVRAVLFLAWLRGRLGGNVDVDSLSRDFYANVFAYRCGG